VNKNRLDSWKAIAGFLNRSLRTVQRWHECNGLPVHHFGGNKGSVFAYEEEINHWLAGLAEESGSVLVRADDARELNMRRSYELTMAANGMWETRSERNIHAISDLYRKAIDDDPRNGGAFSGLANAMVFCALNEIMDGSMAYPSAVEALRRMPQLGAEALDARCSAAWIDLLYNRNWRQARAGFEEVVSLRPSSFALAGLAAMDIAEGRIPEALRRGWDAWRLSPLVHSLGAFFSWIVYLSGDFQQALDMVAQIRFAGGDGNLVTTIEALALIQEGSVEANLARIEKAAADFPQNQTLQGILGYAYAVTGEKNKAWRKHAHLAQSSETHRKSNGYALAIVSMGLSDSQKVIAWLETAYAEGTLWSLGFRSDPLLRIFRGDPRFERLVSRIGVAAPLHAEAAYPGLVSHPYLEGVLAAENS
jgi:tetratricopeptide (TPR) repeat protein